MHKFNWLVKLLLLLDRLGLHPFLNIDFLKYLLFFYFQMRLTLRLSYIALGKFLVIFRTYNLKTEKAIIFTWEESAVIVLFLCQKDISRGTFSKNLLALPPHFLKHSNLCSSIVLYWVLNLILLSKLLKLRPHACDQLLILPDRLYLQLLSLQKLIILDLIAFIGNGIGEGWSDI